MTQETAYYPVVLDLSGRRCVVLGDTEIAREKVSTLRAIGAAVTHLPRSFRPADLAGAFLAIDASGDTSTHTAVRAEADREHVLLNVVDVAQQCDWIAPAVVRRGPLQVAVSTSGESPYLARALRERIEGLLGEEWGPFTRIVGGARRRLRRAGVSGTVQQRTYRRLLHSDTLALLRAGDAAAATSVALSIEHGARDMGDQARMGEVVLAGAGPGDADLVTPATRAVLADADIVLHDALIGTDVLRLCGSKARRVYVGKRAGRESTEQDRINALMIDAARGGELVVRLKGGDPFLFGRGGEEVRALRDAGIPVRVLPGVSAALAAPTVAGIPVTHRSLAGSVAIVTGHRAEGAMADLERIATSVDTLVVMMPRRLEAIARQLSRVLGEGTPAALISRATTPAQRVVRAPIGRIAALARESGIEAPTTLVVGAVVDVLVPTAAGSEIRAVAATR